MITEHFILAQNSSIDRDSNTISVFQFLEDLTIQTVSGQMQLPVQAIMVLRREEEKGRIETKFSLKVLNPEKKEVMSQIFSLKMEESHRRSRLRVNFAIPVSLSGEYKVTVENSEIPRMNCHFSFFVNLVREVPRNQVPTQ